jgi:dolichol-phosphate mannosyltransferase
MSKPVQSQSKEWLTASSFRVRGFHVQRSISLQNASTIIQRWARFGAVGATGIVVQALLLAFFLHVVGLHYLVATAIAVEASVLHTFIWHRRWTWADRPQSCAALMLLRFNLTSGAMSLVGNLILMFIFVNQVKLNAFAANLITIGICSLINFTLSDRFVFV